MYLVCNSVVEYNVTLPNGPGIRPVLSLPTAGAGVCFSFFFLLGMEEIKFDMVTLPTNDEQAILPSTEAVILAWWPVFRFFQYRKCLRLYQGSLSHESHHAGPSVVIILCWLIVFAINSVTFTSTSVSFVFNDLLDSSRTTISLYIGLSLNLISLILILIATFWQVGRMISLFLVILVLSAIVTIVLASIEGTGRTLAQVIVSLVTTILLADIICYYSWTSLLLPGILRFVGSRDHKTAEDGRVNIFAEEAQFPYVSVILLVILSVLLLPLWVPILISYVIFFVLQIVGLNVINRSHFEFLMLSKDSYDFRLDEYSIKESGPSVVTISYRLKPAVSFKFVHQEPFKTFTYKGMLGRYGLPHGEGQYIERTDGDEILNGIWRDGYPIAPFTSREQRTKGAGGSFSGKRVLFVNTSTSSPIRHSSALTFQEPFYGIASVESNVSGIFYSGFPHAEAVALSTDFDEIFEEMCSIRITNDDRENSSSNNSTTSASSSGKYEVLIFFHGYNSYVSEACRTFGQMLSLASYPANIIPTVFSWPAGRLYNFSQAKAVCEGDELYYQFVSFLHLLQQREDVAKIHVLSHSMGCRAIVSILGRMASEGPFMPNNTPPSSTSSPVVTVVTAPLINKVGIIALANPEADLHRFRSMARGICRICDRVTVYVNEKDFALLCASIFNSRVYCRSHCRCSIAFDFEPSLGRAAKDMLDEEGDILEKVDVIDTSTISSNIHEIRHSFFYISREMIEDMRELFTYSAPAAQRTARLLRRSQEGNCFDICVAPKSVSTI